MTGSITETVQSVFKATGNLSSACLDMQQTFVWPAVWEQAALSRGCQFYVQVAHHDIWRLPFSTADQIYNFFFPSALLSKETLH